MKRSLYLFFILCIVLLSSCTKKTEAITSHNLDIKKPHSLLITDASGIVDLSFNAAAFSGLLMYYNDTIEQQKYRGIYYDIYECSTNEEAQKIIEQAVQEGMYQLIIAPGNSLANALFMCAVKYPHQKFMIVDTDQNTYPNVIEFTYSEEQGSFLVGAAAALQAQFEGVKNPVFGFIGGEQSLVITKFQLGYIQGITSVYPDAIIEEYYTGAWNRVDLAQDKSRQWYSDGMYAVFSAAGAAGLGVVHEAKKFRKKGYNVWALGVDSDQYEYGLYAPNKSAVLTSMIKDVGTAVMFSLQMMEAGNFIGGSVRFDLVSEGVSFSKTNRELLPQVIVSVDKLKKLIIEGKLTVYESYKDAQDAGVVGGLLYAVYE